MTASVRSFIILLAIQAVACAGDYYKWTDREGVIHMTDNLSQVPAEYREQVEKKASQSARERQMNAYSFNEGKKPSLRRFEIPYQAFEGSARRIIIPVVLNDSVHTRLLLDTGSPGLMISPELADRLGLPDEQNGGLRVRAAGIGGSTSAILSIVDTIRVGEARAEFLPATIAKVPSDQFEGLVGMDFMANYHVGIDIKNDVVVFEELPPNAERPGGHDEAWWRSTFRNFERLKEEWGRRLEELREANLSSSEKERQQRYANEQYEAAEELCRKLERFARDNAVPVSWRR